MSEADARRIWDELWEAGKTPEELAKGRDLSAEAHRDVWSALFDGMADPVDAFTHSFEVGAEKSDPAIFLAACARIGVAAADALMVGNHPTADGGAAAAGLRVLILPA